METVGERIRHIRKDKGMTQKEFAEKIGISRSTLAGYETNQIEPSLNVIFKMAIKFDVPASYFLRTMNIGFPSLDDNSDILTRIDELMKLVSREDVTIGNTPVPNGSELSRIIYCELKSLRNLIVQFSRILDR